MISATINLVFRSLICYRKQHLLLAVCAAIITTIIGGAILIGDSVNLTLYRLVENRLGKVNAAVKQDKLFLRSAIADGFSPKTAALLNFDAYLMNSSGSTKIKLYGVDASFFRLSCSGEIVKIPHGSAMVNPTVSRHLKPKSNDPLIIRLVNPALPAGYQLLSAERRIVTMRFDYAGVIESSNFGDFSLENSQEIPLNVFVDREYLAKLLGLNGKCNWLITANDTNTIELTKQWSSIVRPEDLGWRLRKVDTGLIELKSNNIFLNNIILDAIVGAGIKIDKIMTGFASSISGNNTSVSYSFIGSSSSSEYPDTIEKYPNIWVSDWLAEALCLKKGDPVVVDNFDLSESTIKNKDVPITFLVSGFYRMDNNPALSSFKIDFPGLEESSNCRSWSPEILINYSSIKPIDEEFWQKYKNLPKAIISYSVAQKLWGSKSNVATSCLLYSPKSENQIFDEITKHLNFATFNLGWIPVRQQSQVAVESTINFSGLFLGLSMVIIISTILLFYMLAKLCIIARQHETIVLNLCGWSQANLFRLKIIEYSIVVLTGTLLGTIPAAFYSYAVFMAISSVWKDSIAGTEISYFITAKSLIVAWMASTFIALVVMSTAIYRHCINCINGKKRINAAPDIKYLSIPQKKCIRWGCFCFTTSIVMAIIVMIFYSSTVMIFLCSIVNLCGTLLICRHFIDSLTKLLPCHKNLIFIMGIRNLARMSNHSMTAICLLAIGIYLVAAVGVNRQGADPNNVKKSSGTGGFQYYIQTALPVPAVLSSSAEQMFFKLQNESDKLVQIKQHLESEASCLNLNRVSLPSLLGIKPDDLFKRKAFSFCSYENNNSDWLALNNSDEINVIPAIADIGVIQWSLHKKIGDYIDYPGANGITWKLKLVAGINNSVFQGNVIVSEKNFDKIFPEHRGYNVFLIDYCSQLKDPKVLMASLERYGISIETTTSRLLRYSAVQNTYLQVFLALGALGLLIGTFGVVIIILRNLLERQVELGWMSVAGFPRITIASMLFFENFATIVLAVLCAIPAIGIIVMPGLYASAAAVPWLELAIFFITLILLSGLIILITSFYAARKSLLQIIRND